MPVPKRKRSRARRDSRFANKGLTETAIALCGTTDCGFPLLPHQVCKGCGHYRGKKVMRTKNERGTVRLEKKKVAEPKTAAQSEQ